ncbi:MAG: hypothetical protein LH472_16070 [Pyrinomonadaceae bacterium]|nr:hypothetical protein [Pyrinomonadaceae bacterium]
MKLKLIAAMCLLNLVMAGSPLMSSSVFAQAKQTKDNKKKKQVGDTVSGTKGTSGSKGADSDPNIKQGEMLNDADAPMGLPTAKGGGNSKGAAYDCEVQLDNWTGWNVKIYINGNYRGVLSGGAESTLYYTPGQTTIYARADFTDGSYYTWGPKTYQCGANQFIYFKMNP